MPEPIEYVIVRSLDGAEPRKLWNADQTMTTSATWPIDLSVQRLTSSEARELSEDQAIRLAPSIRMKLVESPAETGPGLAVVASENWGVRAVGADSSPFDGEGSTVAILDTGIDSAHPAFDGVDLLCRKFSSDGDIDDGRYGTDEDGHGTHCAGTIFGRDVAGERIGVARGVKKAFIGKVLDAERETDTAIVARAVMWAIASGADVISISIGIDFPGDMKRKISRLRVRTEVAASLALEEYFATVQLFEWIAGLLHVRRSHFDPFVLVGAAGNTSQRPEFEVGVCPPAVAEGFISVAALRRDDDWIYVDDYSNAGAVISAPGAGILSARSGGSTTGGSGTSTAAPHVAGVAALWAQKLRQSREFFGPRFSESLIGSGTMTVLRPDSDPHLVGTGIVQAPQS